MEPFPVLLLLILFAIGAATRSPWAFFAVLLVPLYVLGVLVGWWGYGVGDSWQLATILAMLIASATVFVGLLFGFWLESLRRPRLGR